MVYPGPLTVQTQWLLENPPTVSPACLNLLSMQSKFGGSDDLQKAQVLLQGGTMGHLELQFWRYLLSTMGRLWAADCLVIESYIKLKILYLKCNYSNQCQEETGRSKKKDVGFVFKERGRWECVWSRTGRWKKFRFMYSATHSEREPLD